MASTPFLSGVLLSIRQHWMQATPKSIQNWNFRAGTGDTLICAARYPQEARVTSTPAGFPELKCWRYNSSVPKYRYAKEETNMRNTATLSAPRFSPAELGEREWQVFQLTLELLSVRDKRKALRLLEENLGLGVEPERKAYPS